MQQKSWNFEDFKSKTPTVRETQNSNKFFSFCVANHRIIIGLAEHPGASYTASAYLMHLELEARTDYNLRLN